MDTVDATRLGSGPLPATCVRTNKLAPTQTRSINKEVNWFKIRRKKSMWPDDFRKLALRLPEVVEQEHQGHPDFRISGKVFGTLGWPDSAWAMVKLPVAEQQKYTAAQPTVFEAAPGAWGKRGSTKIKLAAAAPAAVEEALLTAWRHVAPKRLAAKYQ